MIGTREWISKVQDTISDGDNISDNSQIFKQGKKISQIISYIWLEQDKEAAQELDRYFKRANTEEGKKNLKKLLFANDSETNEYKLLFKIFKDTKHLPIFHPDDENSFEFRVVPDKFEGNQSDIQANGRITITIPYPPRPEIFDDTTVEVKGFTIIKQSELKEWLIQAPDEKPYIYENNPYIPTTCC